VPNPRKGESKEGFVSRCMGDAEARKTFPDQKQRAAFCYSQYARKGHSVMAVANQRDLLAIQAQSSGTYRIERLSGSDYVVVPVIALVEGVIQGINASEPELALASEFGRFVSAWNGRPVTLDHPFIRTQDDQIVQVSASTTPDVLEEFQVGFIFNSKIDNNRLAMEVWIDPQKMNAHSDAARELLGKVKKGEKIEVSTGLFTLTEEAPGKFNGRDYSNVWRHVVPDHLALLPGDLVGACSIEDGCGVYANAKRLRTATAEEPHFRAHQLVKANCDCSGDGITWHIDRDTTIVTSSALHDSASKEPYGDVTYADSGYQKDGKKRYPVDTPEHIRAAWNYINQQRNADKYTPARLSKVKGAIIAAWKAKIDKKGPPEARNSASASAVWKAEIEDHLRQSATQIHLGGGLVVNASVPDDMLHTDAHQQIQKGLDKEYSGEYPSLVSHTNHDAIFSKYDSGTGGGRRIYSRGYHVDPETKNASFEDDQEREVNLTTSITPTESTQESADEDSVSTHASPAPSTKESQMTDKTTATPGTPSAKTITAEDARKFLANIVSDPEKLKDIKEWPDERVLKLHAKVQAKMKSAKDYEDDNEDTSNTSGKGKGSTKDNTAAPTAEEYLAAAPAGVREALESGMRMHQAHKDTLITKLTSTNRCKFTADQLKAMDIPMLENLVDLAAVPDYGGRAPGGSGDLRAQERQAEKDGDAAYAAPPPRLNIVKKEAATTTETKAA
jgi:hypothetical protein